MHQLEALLLASAADRDLHRPIFFRTAHPEDSERLQKLLSNTPGIWVCDELHGQLRELVRALQPAIKFKSDELDAAAKAHLGSTKPEDYGVWVFYPWSNRLVHLLDEEEFVLVRTDRNRNKITREEQERLSRSRIGVVGLSVGQSVALTMALERGFGEIRLADMDILELSNLNRIRSGVHNLGLRKTVNVAREIAEIDPFLKVTLFDQGLSSANIDDFLTGGGKLDIAVDECDSVDIKILLRQRCKAMQIPVVMDTSDRGMLDVERFDLEPERSILHGLIDHLDPNDAAKAKTNEEKLPFVLPILGIDTLSKRMKASMLEIESSVTTWPQLASSVVLGGALGADVIRRMILGQFTASGRWFVDLDEIVRGPVPAALNGHTRPVRKPEPLQEDNLVNMAAQVEPATTEGLSTAEARQLAEAAALAPSAGNNQPWKFLLQDGRLFLFHDVARGYSQLDGASLIPSLSLGASLENLLLKGREMGLSLRSHEFPLADEPRLVALISRTEDAAAPADQLASVIGKRCTNRRKGDGTPLPDASMAALSQAVSALPGFQTHFLTGTERLKQAADAITAAERIRMLNAIGHEELFGHEIRWTPEEVAATRDGLDIATLELKLSEQAAMRVASDPAAIALLREWSAGDGFKKLSGDGIRTASGLCMISAPATSPEHMLAAGRAVERLWLAATLEGLSVHPISAPVFLSHHVRFGGGQGFSSEEQREIMAAFEAVRTLFSPGMQEPMFIVRLSHADPPTARSLRKPLEEVFHHYQPITV